MFYSISYFVYHYDVVYVTCLSEGWLLPMEELVIDSAMLGKGEFGSMKVNFDYIYQLWWL